MKPNRLLLAVTAVIVALFSAIALTGCGTAQSGQFAQPVAYVGASKLIANSSAGKRPARIAALKAVSEELVKVDATGNIRREDLQLLMLRFFGGDPEMVLFGHVLLGFFPDTLNMEQLITVAHNLALGINAALPPPLPAK